MLKDFISKFLGSKPENEKPTITLKDVYIKNTFDGKILIVKTDKNKHEHENLKM